MIRSKLSDQNDRQGSDMTMIPTVVLFLDWRGWRLSLLAGTAVVAGILLAKLMAFDRRFVNRRFFNRRRAVAYHEAGHAVVARSLGVDVEILSIRPELRDGRPGENTKTYAGYATICPSLVILVFKVFIVSFLMFLSVVGMLESLNVDKGKFLVLRKTLSRALDISIYVSSRFTSNRS